MSEKCFEERVHMAVIAGEFLNSLVDLRPETDKERIELNIWEGRKWGGLKD